MSNDGKQRCYDCNKLLPKNSNKKYVMRCRECGMAHRSQNLFDPTCEKIRFWQPFSWYARERTEKQTAHAEAVEKRKHLQQGNKKGIIS